MIRLSYCPTMEPYAEKIAKNFDDIDLMPASSAAEVLYMLRSGNIDGALIGRVAYDRELDEKTKGYRLKGGNTLIYRQKAGIGFDQLKEVEVYTYLPEEEIKDVENAFKNVIYFQTLDECLKDGLATPVLINWEDYRDEFELLIPMDMRGKVSYFRAPVLYYKDEKLINTELLDKMKEVLN
jgi:hypothetical protein